MSSGKKSGKDSLPPEVFKYGGQKLAKKLHSLFVKIWQTGNVPQDFKDALIQHLYKSKGNRNICDNHRRNLTFVNCREDPGMAYSQQNNETPC